MQTGSKQYKIFFPIVSNSNWLGGLNYYKNLFHAISLARKNFIICIPERNPKELFQYAQAINFHKKNIKYYLVSFLKKLTKQKFNKTQYFMKQIEKDFDVFSHTSSTDLKSPVISWIPDFQHVYLPEYFSQSEIEARNKSFSLDAQKSKIVILSSNDAKKDFDNLYPEYRNKSRVLHFVSYISPEIYEMDESLKADIVRKYNLPEKYFYVPNQFWQHKNHITIFKAVKFMKDNGVDVNVICSGNIQDYRNKNYFDKVLKKYIIDNGIEENIKFLGIIDLNDVYYLMRNCISIINPSLFEGWSSTVEEAKSLGKNIILSDLSVHKEQNPLQGKYFERTNYEQLAQLMTEDWKNLSGGPNFELEREARKNMNSRMEQFGRNYLEIVKETLNIQN